MIASPTTLPLIKPPPERAISPAWHVARPWPQLVARTETSTVRTTTSLPRNSLASLPSILSALRLATLASELTFMGATLLAGTLVDPTLRSRAGPPPEFVALTAADEGLLLLAPTALAVLAVLWLVTRSSPFATLPVRVLRAVTGFEWPRWKSPAEPVWARAVVATPSIRARITARPTRNTVALPTHITLLKTLLTIAASSSSCQGHFLPRGERLGLGVAARAAVYGERLYGRRPSRGLYLESYVLSASICLKGSVVSRTTFSKLHVTGVDRTVVHEQIHALRP